MGKSYQKLKPKRKPRHYTGNIIESERIRLIDADYQYEQFKEQQNARKKH